MRENSLIKRNFNSNEISTRQSHGRQQSDEDTVSTEQLVKWCEAIKGN